MSRSASERGMILVVVLWSVSMMAVIVVALSAYAQRNLVAASIEMDRLRTEMALRSGVEAGGGLLLAIQPRDRGFLDGATTTVGLGDGLAVEVGLRDASGLIDINRMSGDFLVAALERVSDSPQAAEEMAAAILERRKLVEGDEKPASEQPAQEGQEGQEGQEKPMPAVFTSVSELYGLGLPDRGVMPAIMAEVGLYSRGGRINPMSAAETVLAAIPDITPADLGELQSAKRRKDVSSPQVQAVFARYEKFITSAESRVFQISVRIASGTGVIAGSRVKATIILDSSGSAPFQVMAWSW